MVKFDVPIRRLATHVAVILADVASASSIMEAAPFPPVQRRPRDGEMYHVYKDHVKFGTSLNAVLKTKTFERDFVCTFATPASAKRRRDDSPESSSCPKKRRTVS